MNHLPIPLPSPADNPQGDVVIYDGKCVFCSAQVRNLKRFDGNNRLAFVSLHDPFVAQHYPDLTHEQLMEQMYVVPHDRPDARLGGADAIRYLTRRLPKLWLLAPFLHIPLSMPFWRWAYRQVAKRRYRIANRDGQACDAEGTCELHYGDRRG